MNYIVEIYCGKTYCGNAFFETEEKCIEWAHLDGFADEAIIINLQTGEKNKHEIERSER